MIKLAPLLAIVTILYGFMNSIITHDAIRKPSNVLMKSLNIAALLLFTVISLGLIGISTVPHGKLHTATNISHNSVSILNS
jgi:hypothetical protein